MPSRLLKNYCGGSSAALRGARNPHVRLCTFRFLRSVRLASAHPRYVFQQPARELYGWLRGWSTASRQRGFTLIELLAAISILSIVAVLSWRGLDTIVRTRHALTAALEQTRGMQLAFAQMQNDCGQVARADDIGARPNLLAEPGRLTLVRSILIENQPTRMQVVAYRLREGVLTRYESELTRDLRTLDAMWSAAASDSAMGVPVALLSGITDMNLRLWSPSTGWRSVDAAAPPANAASPVPTGLEVALRLSANENGLVKVMLLGAI